MRVKLKTEDLDWKEAVLRWVHSLFGLAGGITRHHKNARKAQGMRGRQTKSLAAERIMTTREARSWSNRIFIATQRGYPKPPNAIRWNENQSKASTMALAHNPERICLTKHFLNTNLQPIDYMPFVHHVAKP